MDPSDNRAVNSKLLVRLQKKHVSQRCRVELVELTVDNVWQNVFTLLFVSQPRSRSHWSDGTRWRRERWRETGVFWRLIRWRSGLGTHDTSAARVSDRSAAAAAGREHGHLINWWLVCYFFPVTELSLLPWILILPQRFLQTIPPSRTVNNRRPLCLKYDQSTYFIFVLSLCGVTVRRWFVCRGSDMGKIQIIGFSFMNGSK